MYISVLLVQIRAQHLANLDHDHDPDPTKTSNSEILLLKKKLKIHNKSLMQQ